MFYDFKPITINDVVQELNEIINIDLSDTDNEGEHINSKYVYPFLSNEVQEKVDNAQNITRRYIDQSGKRAITELNKHGFKAHFNPDQYDPDRNVGYVEIGDSTLDISDESPLDLEDD